MVHRIIQAVAGSGKTYHITHDIDPTKRYLFVTFTNGNVDNIRNELIDSKQILNHYSVSTFSKFLIDWCLKPFVSKMIPVGISQHNGEFTEISPPEARDDSGNYNPKYFTQDNYKHYLDKYNRMYLNRISTLVKFNLQKNRDYKELVLKQLQTFVDKIIVDEYQDLTGPEFNVLVNLMKLTKKSIQFVLVGDFLQSGVSQSTKKSTSKLIDIKNVEELGALFKKEFGNIIELDTVTLRQSWRVTPDVAKFIQEKFEIDFSTNMESPNAKKRDTLNMIQHPKQLNDDLLKSAKILYYPVNSLNSLHKSGYQTVNWSYSKGDTYNKTIVVLTNSLKDIFNDDWSASMLGDKYKTRNQLYVALTRSSGEVYIVSSNTWNSYHYKP